jgi:Family of unknown function (DUF6159)
MGRIQRSWALTKASWAILVNNPRLLILPAISAGAIVAAVAGLVALFAALHGGLHVVDGQFPDLVERDFDLRPGLALAGLLVVVYVFTAITVFFNAALIFCVLRCYAGQVPSIRDGLAAAAQRLPQILGWSLVSLVVGVIIGLIVEPIKDRVPFLGSFLEGMLDLAWAVVTYFVLPVIVVESLGPIDAVKRSGAILRQTWGQSLFGNVGLGIVGFFAALPAVGVIAGGIAVVNNAGMIGLGLFLIVSGVLGLLAISVVMAMLGSIFQTGVYIYATTGQAPLDEALLKQTFAPKGEKQSRSWTRWFGR